MERMMSLLACAVSSHRFVSVTPQVVRNNLTPVEGDGLSEYLLLVTYRTPLIQ